MAIEGKPRVVIWIFSNDNRFINDAINILEKQFNGIDIVGVTASQKVFAKDKHGREIYFIPLNELNLNGGGGYDILLVAGAKQIGMAEVTKFAKSINLNTEKLLGDWIVCIQGFTLEKYRRLHRSRLSIFAINCFGGQIHHTLGLPFLSPFINLFFESEDYIRLLRHPRIYMEENLMFEKMDFNKDEKFDYPICTLGNVHLHMLHYKTFDEAVNKWNERRQRINWYNILLEMHTNKLDILEKFAELPFSKKVCFIPFKSDIDEAFYLNPKFNKGRAFAETVFDISQGRCFYYDVFDMLLYGKKTPLIEI